MSDPQDVLLTIARLWVETLRDGLGEQITEAETRECAELLGTLIDKEGFAIVPKEGLAEHGTMRTALVASAAAIAFADAKVVFGQAALDAIKQASPNAKADMLALIERLPELDLSEKARTSLQRISGEAPSDG